MRSLLAGGSAAALLIALLGSSPLAGQTEVGVLGGATFSTVSGDDVADDAERRTGFVAGAFLRFPLGNVILFQPEATYVQKGAEFDEGADFERALRLDYFEVPLLLMVRAPTSGVSLHGLLGPTIAFEVGCKVELSGPGDTVDFEGDCEDEDDPDTDRNSLDTGLMLGAGIDLPLGGLALTLSGRYTLGLESFVEDDAAEAKHRTISAVAALRFPVGG